jgi:predicted RNA-binding Zn ribbon-like protein
MPEFRLVGRPSLDLVATLGRRHAEPVERLPGGAAVAAWLQEAGVLPSGSEVRVTASQLERLRRLREAIHRLVRATMTGDPAPPDDVAVLNAAASRPDLAPQLGDSGRAAVTWTDRQPFEAALATIARDAVLLLSSARADRLRECGNPDCSLVFIDDSQSGRRRWCSMDRCGNLAKIHAYRRKEA